MKRRIEEGTWFAVALRDGGYVPGVVARSSPRSGVLLAYFFNMFHDGVPEREAFVGLRPSDSMMILRVGDLGLLEGKWPIVGRDSNWQRADWPMPTVVRRDELSRKAWEVHYADDDPNRVVAETRTSYDTTLDPDTLHGYGAAEIVLTQARHRGVRDPARDHDGA